GRRDRRGSRRRLPARARHFRALRGRAARRARHRPARACLVLRLGLELVADAVARLDERVPRGAAVELVAEAPHEHVDGAVAPGTRRRGVCAWGAGRGGGRARRRRRPPGTCTPRAPAPPRPPRRPGGSPGPPLGRAARVTPQPRPLSALPVYTEVVVTGVTA